MDNVRGIVGIRKIDNEDISEKCNKKSLEKCIYIRPLKSCSHFECIGDRLGKKTYSNINEGIGKEVDRGIDRYLQ